MSRKVIRHSAQALTTVPRPHARFPALSTSPLARWCSTLTKAPSATKGSDLLKFVALLQHQWYCGVSLMLQSLLCHTVRLGQQFVRAHLSSLHLLHTFLLESRNWSATTWAGVIIYSIKKMLHNPNSLQDISVIGVTFDPQLYINIYIFCRSCCVSAQIQGLFSALHYLPPQPLLSAEHPSDTGVWHADR